jgi:methionyl-tRNA formyltransferase
MSVSYPYADGPRLDDRNTYFYSSYQGADFLVAWADVRSAVFAELPGASAPPPVNDSLPPGTTGHLLERLFSAASTSRNGLDLVRPDLDRVIQRYEVTKRLHSRYNERFRAVDPMDFRDLALYVRFAEILELAYREEKYLPALNALLKVVDTLCALRSDLSLELQARLAWLIGREKAHILSLYDSLASR